MDTGLDIIKEKDTFAIKLGIEILEAAEGRSKVAKPLGEGAANSLVNVHGGAIVSIADMALDAAANSEGMISVDIQANIHYRAPCVSEGMLYASAERTGETRSSATTASGCTSRRRRCRARPGDGLPQGGVEDAGMKRFCILAG